jgi:SAM-dependent methyltransferase
MTARTLTVSRSVMDATLPFALPIGLSAFLLFTVEPLIGRLVLPVFGGSPAVWATTLFFFQAILLIGYLYGHTSVTRFGRLGPPIHLAFAGLAFIVLLNAPSRLDELRNDAVTPVVDLVGILFALIGLPAFVLTTTTPLLSGWFHAARGDREGDPYWLYALSNAGSLIALVAYPLLIEPRIGLGTQRGLWTIGYAALVVLIGAAALRALPDLSARRRDTVVSPELPVGMVGGGSPGAAAIDGRRRLRWLLLAAVPSGLLTAVTNFIATDLVSAPLLWVIPLAIYLASFVVAFSPRGKRLVRFAAATVPAAVTLMWVPYGATGFWPILAILAVELVCFALIATGLHGRLALDRPDPAHLTEFYLILSTGGALASFFVAVLAPSVFPDIWEYPILLVGALAALALTVGVAGTAGPGPRARQGLNFGPFFAGFPGRAGPFLVGSAILVALLVSAGIQLIEPIVWLAIGGLLLAVGGRPWFLVAGSAVVLVVATLLPTFTAEYRARSFFGVTEVVQRDDVMLLMNGTKLHGAQFTDPARRRIPATYYGRNGPVGDVFAVGADASAVRTKNIAIVGLGAGALAAYKDNWMSMTYFEIDPVVIEVATDPRFFTFLSDAPGAPKILAGDARLSLAVEPDATYDLLVLDAFSSDAIPVHLLTIEAIRDELRTLKPDGLIVFHVSNRYYDLEPAISAALAQLGVTPLQRGSSPADAPEDAAILPSSWLAASANPEHIDALRSRGWIDARTADHPFTDDYADLLSYLKLGF